MRGSPRSRPEPFPHDAAQSHAACDTQEAGMRTVLIVDDQAAVRDAEPISSVERI